VSVLTSFDPLLQHRIHCLELCGAQCVEQLADDDQVRDEDVVEQLRDGDLHVPGRGHHSRRARLELVVRHTHHPLLHSIQVLHNSNIFYFFPSWWCCCGQRISLSDRSV